MAPPSVASAVSMIAALEEAVACLEKANETLESGHSSFQVVDGYLQRTIRLVSQSEGGKQQVFLRHLAWVLDIQRNLLEHKCQCRNEDKSPTGFHRGFAQSMLLAGCKLHMSDVAGLQESKRILNEAFVLPIKYPHLFTGARKSWTRILLYGPPGTGKTRLAQALASQVQSAFFSVSSSDLVSSWLGESEKLVKELFSSARSVQGPSVIFIDEIDSVCRSRTAREEDHSRRLKTELLKQMEGSETPGRDVFVIGATNCPWELDSAFLRRFQQRIYIPLPDRDTRLDILQLHCRGTEISLTRGDWDMIAKNTNGFSGSDLASLATYALLEPVRQLQATTHWRRQRVGERWPGKLVPCEDGHPAAIVRSLNDLSPEDVGIRSVVVDNFLAALRFTHATVAKEDVEKFEQFTAKYGQNG